MNSRVDPMLIKELKQFGAVNIEACFNCGNCTAICPLTSDEYAFPRNMIRRVQIGQRDRIMESLDPWLCYYCGDCSATCPKEAEPAETMMSLRRWLTAQYDWTGLAQKFYTSKVWEFGSMIFVGLLIILWFVFFHGPIVTDEVALNTFAPVEVIHLADWIMAGGLTFFIFTNVFKMYQSIILRGTSIKIPFQIYITEAWNLIFHAATQRRWVDCDEEGDDPKKRFAWITHLLMVSGYGIMLIVIIFFLEWFQTDEIYPIWHPQRWLGYYATAVLLFGAGKALWGRMKKEIHMHKFSHASDWIFPVLVLTVTLTGILMHTFRYLGMPLPTYYTYVIHLALTGPMLILEVPFGKWAHLYYRPLAIYFQKVKEKAHQQELVPLPSPASD